MKDYIEAFNKVEAEIDKNFDIFTNDFDFENLDIVERALNEYTIASKLLEIIKEKKVDVFTLTISGNTEMYNKRRTFGFELTQQEFDLLKIIF